MQEVGRDGTEIRRGGTARSGASRAAGPFEVRREHPLWSPDRAYDAAAELLEELERRGTSRDDSSAALVLAKPRP
jgi:hypothetical protein